jgi:hypothetical protein
MNDQQAHVIIEAFLQDHPQWEAQTTWTILPTGERTDPFMSPEGTQAFLWWMYEHELLERPTELPAMLACIRTADQEFTAHHAGICHPKTCPFDHEAQ